MTQLRQSSVPAWPIVIGGVRTSSASGETIEAVNPATGELIGRVPRCRAEDVDAAVRSAREAFPAWRRVPISERAKILRSFADAVEARSEELVALDVADNGTPVREMAKDASLAVEALRYFAGLALQVRGETVPVPFDRLNYTLREPFGVVARLLPFNHPLLYAVSRLAAPVLAGNTLVMKPSELTSLSALALGDSIAEIFPPGVVNVVSGYGDEAGDALVAHPDVRRIAFTGSVATGLLIQRRAAEQRVKTVTLELGGKNPLAVFPDADLDLALDGAVRGMNFTWQGQSCGSTSRLLVHADIYDSFLERLVECVSALTVGDPSDPCTDVGAIVSSEQLEKVQRYIRLAEAEGARLLTGGTAPDDPDLGAGNFIRPTVLGEVEPGSTIEQNEVFGPVLSVIRFSNYDEAIRIANDVAYGLTAGVYTSDLRTAIAFVRDVDCGYTWVNESSRHIAGASFGGMKESGVGREEDLGEIESYTQVKNVHIRFEWGDEDG